MENSRPRTFKYDQIDMVSALVNGDYINKDDQIMMQLGIKQLRENESYMVPRIEKLNNAILALALIEYGYARIAYLDVVNKQLTLLGWLDEKSFRASATFTLTDEELCHFTDIEYRPLPDEDGEPMFKYIYGKLISKRGNINKPATRDLLGAIVFLTYDVPELVRILPKYMEDNGKDDPTGYGLVMIHLWQYESNGNQEAMDQKSDLLADNMDLPWGCVDFYIRTKVKDIFTDEEKETFRDNCLKRLEQKFSEAYVNLG